MADIIPAILTNDLERFARRVRAAERFAPLIQIDITDGTLTRSTSITAADIRDVRPTVPFELHLMVEKPEDILPDYLALNPVRVIVHRRATRVLDDLLGTIAAAGVEPAIGVSPSSLDFDLEPYLDRVKQVTFVSVEPGFQGGALIPGVLIRARDFHIQHPSVPIEVDGGVKAANLPQVLAVGAQRIVVGSGIWWLYDAAGEYAALQKEASAP